MVSLKGSLCSQGFYHKPFEAHLVATVHRAGIVGIGLVILLFHVVKIVHYLHYLVFSAVMLLQRRTKKAVGLDMTGITLLDMLDMNSHSCGQPPLRYVPHCYCRRGWYPSKRAVPFWFL